MNKRKLKLFSSNFNRSEHMKQLHAQGRYAGTSRIGEWNVSEEKRARMAELRSKNALDKNAKGYGSERAMRVNNKLLLNNKFQGEMGYLYFLEYPKSIKVGFSKNWERRVNNQLTQKHQLLAGKVIMIISGPTNELAELEYNTFIKFMMYTQLSQDGSRYTEFLDKQIKQQVYKFLEDSVNSNDNLKFEIINKL